MLAQTRDRPHNEKLAREFEADVWGDPEEDVRVGSRLDTFRSGIEALCVPILNRQFKQAATSKPSRLLSRLRKALRLTP